MNRLLACLCLLVAMFSGVGCQSSGAVAAPKVILSVGADNAIIDEAVVAKAVDRRVVVQFDDLVRDRDGNGVVIVRASNVTIQCQGVLRGAGPKEPADAFSGTGMRIEGQTGVTVMGFQATGFKVGISATNADGLKVIGARFDNLWRMHLKSTPEKENQDDWLWPHENDQQEWVTNYGAAICIERSKGVTVSGTIARNGQNGLILDRVSGAEVYDNDLSLLSGWGIAMWRSSENTITRNGLDFCVRGYSHGKYNRGQDSAGLLMFEQCSGNVVAENSITHCGDGIFVFAGKEALGEKKPAGPEPDYTRLGCNDNIFYGNDLSFAAAHGLEVTFSFGNRVEGNTFEGNAICGIWGGYSQQTVVNANTFKGNGQKGYGEGGGINIEHGYQNLITDNTFDRNSVCVKLWDDDDGALLKTPWALANHHGSRGNEIVNNRVTQEGGAAFWVRKSVDTVISGGGGRDASSSTDADKESTFASSPGVLKVGELPKAQVIGATHPVGARNRWRGREFIVMGEWGPVTPVGAGAK